MAELEFKSHPQHNIMDKSQNHQCRVKDPGQKKSIYCVIPARNTFSLLWNPQTLDMLLTVFMSATNIPSTAPGIFRRLTHSSHYL